MAYLSISKAVYFFGCDRDASIMTEDSRILYLLLHKK